MKTLVEIHPLEFGRLLLESLQYFSDEYLEQISSKIIEELDKRGIDGIFQKIMMSKSV